MAKNIRSKLYFTLLLCAVVFLFSNSFYGLDPNRKIGQFHHTAWTAKDGAPSQISALAQTSDGYLWIGSALGLFRFDGIAFEQYMPDGVSLPSNNIYALMPTPDGGLWISFRPSGIGFLKDGKLRVFSRLEELPASQVYTFARTSDDIIWAGTHNGLAFFNGAGWTEIGADWGFQPNRVREMFIDRAGTLWVSTDNSLNFLPVGAKKFRQMVNPGKYAIDLAQAQDGRLWAARFPKLISPINDPELGKIDTNPEIVSEAWKLLFDRDGSLWTASSNQVKRIRFPEKLGTEKILPEDDSRVETFQESDGLSGSFATNILEDREGNIWVGTAKGLDRFRYSPIVPVALPEGAQRLTLAAAERGEIWAGVAVYDFFLHIRDGQVEKNNSVSKESFASSIYRDRDGVLWWGMRGGILRQKDTEFKFFPQPKEMVEDWIWEVFRGQDDGGMWVSFGDEGLIYFKDGGWERREPPAGLPARGPSATFEDSRNRIWLGYTENRVYVLDGKDVRGYSSADGIEIGRIKVIRGRGADLWCGGETGLAVLIGGKFHTVKADGKSFGAVSGIIKTANGDLWLNEIHGIVRIPASEVRQLIENPEYSVKYRLFDYEDNLPGGTQMNFTVSTAVEATDGRLWFATDNGLAVIDPALIEKNTLAPPVSIKSVSADGKISDIAYELKFPPAVTELQIAYTAPSLSIPERVLFRYRLENFETEWREAGNRREAFYTNLAPGKYRFQVIAANNDGVWNEQGATLDFEILPAFYQTKWFLLLCLAALAALVFAAITWRVRQVRSRLHLLYEERLNERTRIAQDLHDTLLQGLVGVSMQLDSAVNKLPANSLAKPRFERMREMMAQIIREGRNTVNGLRAAEKTNVSRNLEQDLRHIAHKLNTDGKTKFIYHEKGSARPLCIAIHDEVYYICHEALANAFQHSDAGEITAEIEYSKNLVTMTIRDNGIGIDPRYLKSGREDHWGLSGMRERALKIGAKLQITSRARVGTEIELVIPGHVAFETEGFGIYRAWRSKFPFAGRAETNEQSEKQS